MGRILLCGVTWLVASSGVMHAQSVSFSSMTPQEECADMARRLAGMKGRTLALRLRQLDQRWTMSPLKDDVLEARAVAQYPCLAYSFAATQCAELQRVIPDTVGDTLGARFKVLFPQPTRGMRDQYAEMFVRSFCPDLKGPAPTLVPDASVPVTVLVEPPVTADGFVPPAMVGLAALAKHLNAELIRNRHKMSPVLQARNRADADLVVAIAGREALSDRRTVRATVSVQGKTFDFDATSDDAEYETAVDNLALKIVEWITENHARIVEGRPKP